jgi:hypothetical protein
LEGLGMKNVGIFAVNWYILYSFVMLYREKFGNPARYLETLSYLIGPTKFKSWDQSLLGRGAAEKATSLSPSSDLKTLLKPSRQISLDPR